MPGWRSSVLLLCLFVMALDSKEISVLLPVATGLYELVWHPPTGLETRRVMALDPPPGPFRSHRRSIRRCLHCRQEVRSRFVYTGRITP